MKGSLKATRALLLVVVVVYFLIREKKLPVEEK
jgi:hypothetical protein